jgi:hypothetical protein
MKFTFNSVHAVVGTVAVALVSLSMSGRAQAAGITASIRPAGQTTTAVAGSQTWDFSGAPPSGVTLAGGALVGGSLANQYADPGLGDTYLTVGGSVPDAPTASLKFSNALEHLGIFWGTPDSYNTLEFYNAGSFITSFVPGSSLALAVSGNNTDARYVDFFANAGTVFDEVMFKSGSPAFEVDNLTYSAAKVPSPMMLPAAIGFGITMLKRRKLAAQG